MGVEVRRGVLETRFHLLIRNFTGSPHEGAKICSVFRTLHTCCLSTQECVRHDGLAIARHGIEDPAHGSPRRSLRCSALS